MDKTILICLIPFLVCFILFLKSIFIGSKLGKATGIILYSVFAIFFGLLLGYSFVVEADANDMVMSNKKSSIEIQHKRTLPSASIPKFLDKPNPGTVLGLQNKAEVKKESQTEFNSEFKTEFKTEFEPVAIAEKNNVSENNVIEGTGVKEKNKGKIIGNTDSKIYHVPGSTYYERAREKESNNVYFNTVQEAEAAGYRAPKR